MQKRIYLKNQKGFTLLEMMSVLVILGVMVSIAIQKFDLLSDTASINAIRSAIRELNTRETLTWTRMKLSENGWLSDDDIFGEIDKNLGTGYSWNPEPTSSGGTLYYNSQPIPLTRTRSTMRSVGSWQKN